MFTLEILQIDEVLPEMLDSFERFQLTTRVLFNDRGTWRETEDSFEDDWTLERKRQIVEHFKDAIKHGGAVVIAKQGAQLVGFAVIEAVPFGSEFIYRELSFLHVTRSVRGRKAGEHLFLKAKEVAKLLGADKLYIGTHPSVETQHFYRKMGCAPAVEINEFIYQREIRDIQLEITL
ncbi:Acetyltransferase (GNAT) domain-containing protein [Paenibacillus sp. UNC496MF]|uniref:GNAT family N-acetyltransferase n=1 Tax=Paenibacillus sp. UNC496MF TaxID=1502753 RepID=UPI0008E5421C|nr:GNAT family N-acetyltransferase [Paenibacillus sp. UNC496MF]SFJ16959.1 Acetyltransferase (GNAT) domain-containing protein [Paenibacillus sp. UNC496MF]